VVADAGLADATIGDACETKLRGLATRLGAPAPSLQQDFLRASRSDELVCPAKMNDVACEQLVRSRVTLAKDETMTVSIDPATKFAYYEFTYTLDGRKHTEHVADPAAATRRLKELAAGGHDVVPTSGERVDVPTGARVARAQIAGAIDRVKRTARIVAPIDKVAESEQPAYFERLNAAVTNDDVELESWNVQRERGAVVIVVACVAPLPK
jgi:hypothetical protein